MPGLDDDGNRPREHSDGPVATGAGRLLFGRRL